MKLSIVPFAAVVTILACHQDQDDVTSSIRYADAFVLPTNSKKNNGVKNTLLYAKNSLTSNTDATLQALTNKLTITTTTTTTTTQQQDGLQLPTKSISDQIESLISSIKTTIESSNSENIPSTASSTASAVDFASLQNSLQETSKSLQDMLQQVNDAISSGGPTSSSFTVPESVSQLSSQISKLTESIPTLGTSSSSSTPEITIALSAVVSYVVISNILTWGRPPPPSQPYPLQKYDPIAAQVYFDARPLLVVQRSLTIAIKSLGFALSLLQDKVSDKWEQNMNQRGLELAQLLTDLGPTFIKSKACIG